MPKKGNIADCTNLHGVTLLSVPSEVFCTILLRQLCELIDASLHEEQARFCSGYSCIEQIFTLHNIIKQYIEFHHPLPVNFIDFKKAFDSVHRESLWNIARIYGIPQWYVSVFKNIYLNLSCCVKTDMGTTDYFTNVTGIHQGCILSPLLFLLVIGFIMQNTVRGPSLGIRWKEQTWPTDIDFADDISLLEATKGKLQEIATNLEEAARKVDLRISTEKAKMMQNGIHSHVTASITVGQQHIDHVGHFTCHGSVVATISDVEADVKYRIGKVAVVNVVKMVIKSSEYPCENASV